MTTGMYGPPFVPNYYAVEKSMMSPFVVSQYYAISQTAQCRKLTHWSHYFRDYYIGAVQKFY